MQMRLINIMHTFYAKKYLMSLKIHNSQTNLGEKRVLSTDSLNSRWKHLIGCSIWCKDNTENILNAAAFESPHSIPSQGNCTDASKVEAMFLRQRSTNRREALIVGLSLAQIVYAVTNFFSHPDFLNHPPAKHAAAGGSLHSPGEKVTTLISELIYLCNL